MNNRYVNVTITSQTKPTSQTGFGVALVLSTDKDAAYKEYSGDTALASVGTDFGAESETYKLVNAVLSQNPRVDKVAILGVLYDNAVDTPVELTTALNTLILSHNDFFYLVSTEQQKEEIEALATWIGTQEKLYFATTTKEILDTITTTVRNAVIIAHDKPEQYAAEALVGAIAPLNIGSYTVTFTQLNGIDPVLYDDVAIDAIETKHAATYITQGGYNIISRGTTMSGEYIDVIQSEFYLKARMTENVFGLLARVKKVPFTTNGIALTVSEVEKTLAGNVENLTTGEGIIARDADGVPMYTITIPDITDISANDKANRILPDIPWEATISGAIENVDINGVLKL